MSSDFVSETQMDEEVVSNSRKPRAKKDIAPGRLIDLYAAQCDICQKWRIIETTEEYEEIRFTLVEDPFVCEKKQGLTCETPAELVYDSSRTWVIDKVGVPKTPRGFKRSLVLRKDYSKLDTYYITPTGKKLRSRNDIASFVKENPEYSDAPIRDFNFCVPRIVEETIPPEARIDGGSSPKIGSSSSSSKLTEASIGPVPSSPSSKLTEAQIGSVSSSPSSKLTNE